MIWPVFVQQTVVPTGTVTSTGSKKLSPIVISVDPVGQVGPPTPSVSVEAVDDAPS